MLVRVGGVFPRENPVGAPCNRLFWRIGRLLYHSMERGSSSMKILLVISEVPPTKSGVARVADKLQRGFQDRGYTVDILSRRDIPYFERGEIRLSSMPLRLPSLRGRFMAYDVIHLHGPVPTFSDVFLLSGLKGLTRPRPKLVYTYHAPVDLRGFPWGPLTAPYNAVQEWLARLADHVVVMTPDYGLRMSRYVPAEKLSVIPWGVDYDRFYASAEKPDPFTVVYLGQIRPYKGLPVLLRAADGLRDLRLWVIGEGHQAAEYQRLAEEMDLPDVTFWGGLPDSEMIDLLRQAHVLVLPSVTRSEAFGIALLEGMAAGNVPVASHLPGVAELVGNEGFTYPVGDVHALREILIRLRDDAALRLHRACLAQSKSELYSWERTIFEYERLFETLVSSSRGVAEPYSAQAPREAELRPRHLENSSAAGENQAL
jgi:glycosyltransferase involved in cell wall biosynthesis